jgi:hypothetical protein
VSATGRADAWRSAAAWRELLDTAEARATLAEARLAAVGAVLSASGCFCEGHEGEVDFARCVGCRVESAMGNK